MPGEHTRVICRDRLGLDEAQTDRLIADGVLFSWADQRTPEYRATGSAS
jgi:hypothetical protein